MMGITYLTHTEEIMKLSNKEVGIIAAALDAQLKTGGLTVEEAGDISELADRIVANQDAGQDDDE